MGRQTRYKSKLKGKFLTPQLSARLNFFKAKFARGRTVAVENKGLTMAVKDSPAGASSTSSSRPRHGEDVDEQFLLPPGTGLEGGKRCA